MANSKAIPRLSQSAFSYQLSARLPKPPIIPHPMTKLGDRSKLAIKGSAHSIELSRSKTVECFPIATSASFSWATPDLFSKPVRNRRFRKRAMATKSKSDEQILDVVTERLVDGFEGIRKLFKQNDPDGGESVTQEALLHIMYNCIGDISKASFMKLLQNLGLDKKEKISFDLFVSRFKEFSDIQYQWIPPLKRKELADTDLKAHPEEHLRDCETNEWAQLKVAPQATYRLMKALREKDVDMRAILPDECFQPDGVVTKVQMRVALQEIGVNLTDLEYKRFWDRYDKQDLGYVPLQKLYAMLNLNEEGEYMTISPKPHYSPIPVKATPGVPPRSAAKIARDFALGRHKIREEGEALDGVQGVGMLLRKPVGQPAPKETEEEDTTIPAEEGKESPTADAAACAKIRSVMNEKPRCKLDSIIDCLNFKFEERWVNFMMAFKLFDFRGDGHVMRIDFRRVMNEFGFPITALKLGAIISRLGFSINHGLINYRRLLSRALNRSESLTSKILDARIEAIQRDYDFEDKSADSEEKAIVHRFIEYLHEDYIRMAAAFLSSDRHSRCVLPQSQVKTIVEQCLGYSMTDKQWQDLQTKLPLDAEGNVRYIDFMVSFDNGEPGTWNQLKVGNVTVPRIKVVDIPGEEVQRLLRAKTEPSPSPVKQYDNRPVEQLRKELKAFFTEHLHDVDKRFKELDRKSHKRFSKWQFGALLKLCGFPMTEKELNDVWMSLKLSDDNMSTFNNVVMEFSPNFTSFHGYRIEESRQEDEEEVGIGSTDSCDKIFAEKDFKPEKPVDRVLSPQSYLTQIMMKTAPAVRENWDFLRRTFRSMDPHGFGSISFKEMQDQLDLLKCGLTVMERNQLCSQFDFKNTGRCSYLAFMKAFTKPPSTLPKLVYSPHKHLMDKKPKDASSPITVNDGLLRIRKKLIKHGKNLRRGFQKYDRSRSGYMSVVDFKRVLKECSVPVSEEDLYHILSEFDANMDGYISYPEFLDTLLRVG